MGPHRLFACITATVGAVILSIGGGALAVSSCCIGRNLLYSFNAGLPFDWRDDPTWVAPAITGLLVSSAGAFLIWSVSGDLRNWNDNPTERD